VRVCLFRHSRVALSPASHSAALDQMDRPRTARQGSQATTGGPPPDPRGPPSICPVPTTNAGAPALSRPGVDAEVGYPVGVGLLTRFEDRLDRAVNGAFARAFKSEVQPVEIAAALQREVDDRAAVLSRNRTVVPNAFTVDLSPRDHERLSTFGQTLCDELSTLISDYVIEQRYTLVGRTTVDLDLDDELDTGVFRVRSEARADSAALPAFGLPNGPGSAFLEAVDVAYPLVSVITRLGRGTDVDIRIDDPGVSRSHCEVILGDQVLLRDLRSTNGTIVHGQRITEAILTDGTPFIIGATTLIYRSG
jgi:hypothetical protein